MLFIFIEEKMVVIVVNLSFFPKNRAKFGKPSSKRSSKPSNFLIFTIYAIFPRI